jgi:hypothetical protein
MTITQYLLIATRVYPFGKRAKTRRVQVRAWNSTTRDAKVSFNALRDVVVAHYFGVCECGFVCQRPAAGSQELFPKKGRG